MRRRFDPERLYLLLVDFCFINLSTWSTWYLRYRSGLFADPEPFRLHSLAFLALSAYWMLIFALRGQYRKLYHVSRFRSLQEVLRSVGVGLILLFVLTFDPGRPISAGKLLLLSYGAVVFLGAGFGRVLFRTIQKRLLERGLGLMPALIVGFNERGRQLMRQFLLHPGMGYRPLGFVSTAAGDENARPTAGEAGASKAGGATGTDPEAPAGPVLGGLDRLEELIREHQVSELVVTEPDREVLFQVISVGFAQGAEVLIVPDLYDLVLGNVKTSDIWGMPTIQVFPHLMAPWQFLFKRAADLGVSILMLLLGLPLFLLLPPLIRLDSPGAGSIYSQPRVGRGGREFRLYKFRTMHPAGQGPAAARENGEAEENRVTRVGRWLRRYRIDEWPQFWNVFLGQMSLVGPRPERRELVERYIRQWPLYARRHNVRAGLTGWAQVKQRYDQSIREPEDKLRLDLFYLENMNLSLDLKILLFTLRTVLRGEGC